MRILLRNAHILTMDDQYTEYPDGYLLTDGDRIVSLGEGKPSFTADETIDCQGGILLPGFVNVHCHASMVPFRTMGDDCPDRLRRFLFPLENEAMTGELVYLGALFGIAEMLLAGVTTFVDMYYFEEQVARACLEAGMRGYLGETVISQATPDSPVENGGLQLVEEMLKTYPHHDLIRPVVAPHGTTTVSEDTLRACGDLAQKYGAMLTLHVSEMDYEMQYFAERGQTPIQYLDGLGLCNERLLAAHCIHATAEDIALLKLRNARVAHCIGSNTKAGKGVAPIREIAAAGIPYGLGTDGPSSGNTLSLFDQMRLFAVCHKTKNHNRALFPAREIVRAATRGGAEALGAGSEFGMLLPGMKADLTVVSLDKPHLFPVFNPYSTLVYGANASDVSMVMTGGVIRVKDGQLTGLDINRLRHELAGVMGPFRRAATRYADVI
ncbi:MAG: amidohydrolase [Clostridia bacterium]|nr:amidohydrolase [Clostridia bacterium]